MKLSDLIARKLTEGDVGLVQRDPDGKLYLPYDAFKITWLAGGQCEIAYMAKNEALFTQIVDWNSKPEVGSSLHISGVQGRLPFN